MKTLQLPKYKTTHAHAPESTVDVVVFLFYVLNFRFYRTPKQTILAEGFNMNLNYRITKTLYLHYFWKPGLL